MATSMEQVRLLTKLSTAELPDSEIESWLELNDEFPRLAAAEALEAYAGTLTSVQSDDITLDGAKRATVLMARAARLRQQAATAAAEADDTAFAFETVFDAPARPELTERSIG